MAFKKRSKRSNSEYMTWVRKLDKIMSIYIRMRDSQEYNHRYFRCISCGRILPIDQADCGHFLSRRHMSTRFDARNMNAECRACNRFSSDHLIGYRRNLILRLGRNAFAEKYPNKPLVMDIVKQLGTQTVELLEILSRQTKKWSVSELQAMYIKYGEKIMEMRKGL